MFTKKLAIALTLSFSLTGCASIKEKRPLMYADAAVLTASMLWKQHTNEEIRRCGDDADCVKKVGELAIRGDKIIASARMILIELDAAFQDRDKERALTALLQLENLVKEVDPKYVNHEILNSLREQANSL